MFIGGEALIAGQTAAATADGVGNGAGVDDLVLIRTTVGTEHMGYLISGEVDGLRACETVGLSGKLP